MKKTILFVDDETTIIELFRVMFAHMSDEWDVSFANNATEALAMMKDGGFDVIVSDMRMPGMSGAQLLTEVMQRYPKTARLILSGYTEQEAVAKCVGAAHQFLMKPCDVMTLKSTLERVCALDVLIRNEALKTLVARMGVLPSLPSLYFRILKELESPSASIERIAEIVAADPGMTAKLLQIVNSAFFGISRKISNSAEAIQHLGVGTIRSLALSMHAFSCFDQTKLAEFSIQKVWNHSVATGMLAKKIADEEQTERTTPDEAFIAGLLHDLGKLMLASNMSENYRAALDIVANKGMSLWEAEQKIFGATHADVGAYLLGLWGLPVPIVEAVALHHRPSSHISRAFSPLTAVHIANALEHERSGGMTGHSLDKKYLNDLGFDERRLERWRATMT